MHEVSALLGHNQVAMARRCFASLLACSVEPIRLRLHGDGSWTDDDRAALRASFPGSRFVERAEADERMADELARHPALAAFRRRNPLALKLLDAVSWTDGDRVAFVDSDVLFVRRFRGLFDFPDSRAGAVFMRDSQEAYSARSWHLALHPGRMRLARRVNTGVVLFRKSRYDLDALEWYLSKPAFAFSPGWEEQTGWALLGHRAGCWLYDPGQLGFPPAAGPLDVGARRELVGLHFITPLRGRLADVPPSPLDDAPAQTIRSAPAGRAMPWHLAWIEAGRVLKRLRG